MCCWPISYEGMGIKLRYLVIAISLWSVTSLLLVLLIAETSPAEHRRGVMSRNSRFHQDIREAQTPSTELETNPQDIGLLNANAPKLTEGATNLTAVASKQLTQEERIGFQYRYDGIRATRNYIMELWYFVKSQINGLDKSTTQKKKTYMLEGARARMSSALVEVELMYEQKLEQDKAGKVMKHLHEAVEAKIMQLQNPDNCTNVQTLVCNVNQNCGFGCELHHITLCLIISIGTKRTFILKSDNWRYSPKGWESLFMPVSEKCTSVVGEPVMWNGEEEMKNVPVVTLPLINMKKGPSYVPLNIPQDLASVLKLYHGSPSIWWIGQIVSYLLRPQPEIEKVISQYECDIGFKHPIVGIHVRRTDKLNSETSFHSLSEYMLHVVEWYAKEDQKRERQGHPKFQEKHVYIASDDPTVLKDASKRYPEYRFVGDEEISKSAGLKTRYSKSSITGLVLDINLLSKCDFFVGTFSSGVSRVVYELMQTRHLDATNLAHSLDDIYYFNGQYDHFLRTLYDHKPEKGSDEIEMIAGDLIHTLGNHWDGYSKGINERTGEKGLYPSFKATEDVIGTANFPPFLNMKNFVKDIGVE